MYSATVRLAASVSRATAVTWSSAALPPSRAFRTPSWRPNNLLGFFKRQPRSGAFAKQQLLALIKLFQAIPLIVRAKLIGGGAGRFHLRRDCVGFETGQARLHLVEILLGLLSRRFEPEVADPPQQLVLVDLLVDVDEVGFGNSLDRSADRHRRAGFRMAGDGGFGAFEGRGGGGNNGRRLSLVGSADCEVHQRRRWQVRRRRSAATRNGGPHLDDRPWGERPRSRPAPRPAMQM